ncbi:CFEM-domain-containing protein [Westerdykella ornata]|uniref:CFEM-domain-containing protein n=1 Tax=Westerdykella ornata TaxID=318751 RepID=A0A6A6JSB3_WESOR|nr:CFEM-domain-containing protein [Westerdykella ornata]KAF2279452.1 CFEM-domain-containing protein [Westerdykella ornata]
MKSFTAVATLALAAVASAQLENIPSCALSCFLGPLGSSGCAELADFKCQCSKADTLFASVTPCVEKACSASDRDATIAAVENTCAQAGVPVQVPEPGKPSESAAPSSAPPASSQPPAYQTSEAPASSSEAPASSTPAVSSSTVVPTPSGNATIPSGTPPPQFTGAAPHATQAAGLLGAAALAILAL